MENGMLRVRLDEIDNEMRLYFFENKKRTEYIVIRTLKEYTYVCIDRYLKENVGDNKWMYKHEETCISKSDLDGFVVDILKFFILSNGREDHEQRVRDYSKFVDELNMKRFEFKEEEAE